MSGKQFTQPTSRHLKDLLPRILTKIRDVHEERPDLILAAWPSIIGERLAPMTQAVSFADQILTIKVKNSSLLSLLVQHEKGKLLAKIRKQFPNAKIRNIRFCIG